MDDEYADQAWAMLALGAPDGIGVDLSVGRIDAFIDRDNSEGKKRSALLVAGLAGPWPDRRGNRQPAEQPLRPAGRPPDRAGRA